jgi:hypothetical protein
LIDVATCVESQHFKQTKTLPLSGFYVPISVLRFQESIAGFPYVIEVAAVDNDRWRANIVRMPGIPTALMPFYGTTPDQAADQLRQWLTRAHDRVSSAVRRV